MIGHLKLVRNLITMSPFKLERTNECYEVVHLEGEYDSDAANKWLLLLCVFPVVPKLLKIVTILYDADLSVMMTNFLNLQAYIHQQIVDTDSGESTGGIKPSSSWPA